MKKIKMFDVVVTILLAFCGLICLIPILNTIAISFSDKTSAALGIVKLWPINFTTASYDNMMEETQFWVSFLVSLKRVILGVAINMVITILTAYPLSKSTGIFRSKNVYMWIVVFTMMFNGGLVPTFMVVNNLHLMDTMWALVLPGAVPVFNVILLMNFYKGIPQSLEESAWMDGAGAWTVLYRIYLPLCKPSLATIGLFSIVTHWNSYFDGKIYINSVEKMPLQTYIQALSSSMNAEQMALMTADELEEALAVSSLTFNSAKVVVSMVPILLIYPFLQKYFVTGMVVGAVKE